jgi:hypothetical protein
MTAEAASTSSAGLMQSSLPQVGHRIMQEIIGDENINGFWFAADVFNSSTFVGHEPSPCAGMIRQYQRYAVLF